MIRIGLGGGPAPPSLGSAGQASADQYDFISELDSCRGELPVDVGDDRYRQAGLPRPASGRRSRRC